MLERLSIPLTAASWEPIAPGRVGAAQAPSGSVLVVDVGEVADYGYWGEVLTTGAQARGIAGLVIDGGVRDIEAIETLGFPVFASTIALRGASGNSVPHDGRTSRSRLPDRGGSEARARAEEAAWRQQPLHPDVVRLLEAWPERGTWLFPGADGPMDDGPMRALIVEIGQHAGLGRVLPHVQRHTTATLALSRTGDLRVVQELLGHRSIASTQIYTQVLPERLAAVVALLL